MARITFIYADRPTESHSYMIRCKWPGEALREAGHEVFFVFVHDWIEQTFYAMDCIRRSETVILQRNLFSHALSAVVELKAMGKKVVVDLDDHFHEMTEYNASFNFWKKSMTNYDGKLVPLGYNPLPDLEAGVELVDLVTSPSQYLCNWWRGRTNTEVRWVPNFFDMEMYSNPRVFPLDPNHKIIGWGGGNSHRESFDSSEIIPAIEKICQEDSTVQFMMVGDGLKTILPGINIPENQKHFLPHVNFSEWPGILSMFDVFVMPLAGTYDRARSWIKPVEAMLMGVPWVATNYEPYQNLPAVVEEFNLTENFAEDWRNKILYALSSFPGKTGKLMQASERALVKFAIKKNLSYWEKIL